jgi:hypothetical protein
MSGNPSSGSRIATPTALGLDPRLEAAGFNTAGVLSASEYDALVPALWRSAALLANAQSVVVLGCGGRAFSEAFMHSSKARATTERDPIDRFTARVVHAAIAEMAQRGASAHALFYWDQRQGLLLGSAAGRIRRFRRPRVRVRTGVGKPLGDPASPGLRPVDLAPRSHPDAELAPANTSAAPPRPLRRVFCALRDRLPRTGSSARALRHRRMREHDSRAGSLPPALRCTTCLRNRQHARLPPGDGTDVSLCRRERGRC